MSTQQLESYKKPMTTKPMTGTCERFQPAHNLPAKYFGIVMQTLAAIRAGLNLAASRKLIVRMALDNRFCCFYEAAQGVRIALKLPEDDSQNDSNRGT